MTGTSEKSPISGTATVTSSPLTLAPPQKKTAPPRFQTRPLSAAAPASSMRIKDAFFDLVVERDFDLL